MNIALVRGTISAPPDERTLASGTEVVSWQVATPTNDGVASVPVRWEDPTAAVRSCREGTTVVVLGVVRRRFFRAGGATMTRVEILADSFANPRRAASVERLRGRLESRVHEGF